MFIFAFVAEAGAQKQGFSAAMGSGFRWVCQGP